MDTKEAYYGHVIIGITGRKRGGEINPHHHKCNQKGKISAAKTEEGGYQIDRAELFHVWPAVKSGATPERDNATGKKLGEATLKNANVTGGED